MEPPNRHLTGLRESSKLNLFARLLDPEVKQMGKRLAVLVVLVATSTAACSAVEDAVKESIEQQAGCSKEQLGTLDEAALPNCSKAVACCKFIRGQCGETTLFDFPKEVVDACAANEAVLKEAIEQYQGIEEGVCPSYLKDEACAEGTEKTRENYAAAVDKGQVGSGKENAPSCKLIIDNTVVPLNESLGDNAEYLPKACEAGAENASPEPDSVGEGD